MSTGQQRRNGRRVATLFALVVVAGVLGMHALSQHGTGDHESAGVATRAMHAMHVADAMDSGTVNAAATYGLYRPHVAQVSQDTLPPPLRDHAGVAMLCLAVMLVAAGAALALLALRRRARGWDVPGVQGDITHTWARRLAPARAGPPATWEFSVIRC